MRREDVLEEVIGVIENQEFNWSDRAIKYFYDKEGIDLKDPARGFLRLINSREYKEAYLAELRKKIGFDVIVVSDARMRKAVPEEHAHKLNVAGYERSLVPALEFAQVMPSFSLIKVPPISFEEIRWVKQWSRGLPYPYHVMLYVPFEDSWRDLMNIGKKEHKKLVQGFAKFLSSSGDEIINKHEYLVDSFELLYESGILHRYLPDNGRILHWPFMTMEKDHQRFDNHDDVVFFSANDFSLSKSGLYDVLRTETEAIPMYRKVRGGSFRDIDRVARDLLNAMKELEAKTGSPIWIKPRYSASGLGQINYTMPQYARIFDLQARDDIRVELLKSALYEENPEEIPDYVLEEDLNPHINSIDIPGEYEPSGWVIPDWGFLPNTFGSFLTDGHGCYLADIFSFDPEDMGVNEEVILKNNKAVREIAQGLNSHYQAGIFEVDMIYTISNRAIGHDPNLRRGGHSTAVELMGKSGFEKGAFNFEFSLRNPRRDISDIVFYNQVCGNMSREGIFPYSTAFGYVGQNGKLKFKGVVPWEKFESIFEKGGNLVKEADRFFQNISVDQ
ncbi:MAG TPA: hypothetical protein VKO42_01855 [Patescibacteria group bacterium]|nr:hypothetical protein [Patescibacteria group bacterium]